MRHLRTLHVILLPTLLMAVGLLNLTQLNEGKDILYNEARNRHAWPALSWSSLTQGTWTRDFEDAFADRFFQRERALAAADWLGGFYGTQTDIQIHTGQNKDLYNLGQSPTSGADIIPAQTIRTTGAETQPEPPGQWINQILILRKQAFTLAGYYEPAGAYYAQVLNTLASKLDPNVRVFSLLVPTAIEFLDSEKYRKLSYSQADGIRLIYGKLSPRVRGIDAISEMRPHGNEYLYFRTDHHWTGLGAYYAYVATAKRLGVEPLPLTDYHHEDLPGYLGTLFALTRAPTLLPDTVELYYPPVGHVMSRYTSMGILTGKAVDKSYILGSNKYLAYIGGDVPFTEIKTDVHNGRRILILKDSYGNAFVPFLIPHYEEVYVIDPRYYNGSVSALVKQKGIQDVLILNNFVIIAGTNGMAYHILRISG